MNPKQCVDIFAPFLRSKGYDVTVSDTLDVYLNKEHGFPGSDRPGVDDGHDHGRPGESSSRPSRTVSASEDGTEGWATHSATTPSTSSWWGANGWPTRVA